MTPKRWIETTKVLELAQYKQNNFSLDLKMQLIEKHIRKIRSLCDKYHVEKMYVFGSILTTNFSTESDVDFLVKFKEINLVGYFENYSNFKENLKKLLGREIDLVEEQTLKNPILINSIHKNRKLVYG